MSYWDPIHSSKHSVSTDCRDNFKVVIRCRPPLPREIDPVYGFYSVSNVTPDNKRITLLEYLGAEINEVERHNDMMQNPELTTQHTFTFDHVYDEDSTQKQVYETTAHSAVESVLEGYNATILAYGQTGTGKTYTMEGFKYNATDPQKGIVPRANEEIFQYIESSRNANSRFMVRASYLQIYNEYITDLLKQDRGYLQIREEKRRGVFVEGLSEWAVRSPHEIYSLMQKGQISRATACTKMNDISSRSHAVFIIIVEQMTTVQYEDNTEGQQIKVGKLNLVDLAGSERVRVTGATGRCLEEAKKINQSLSALGNVIAALTDLKPRNHIPYRDSKLTRLLEDSLGGNCKTTMMAMISPANEAFLESLSTLKFANRAKNIRNDARINEDINEKALLRKYEIELRRLRDELEKKSQSVMDMGQVMELEHEKKRAEADKEAAIEALEKRSKEYLQEKEAKKKLEERIKLMDSQMLMGGRKIEDTPQFRTALEEKHKAIRMEYEDKLDEIEKERQLIEEDKAQIDRYKQLLLRQRDIMIALTARLNERDETIIQLQEELDAYDKIHKETEEMLEAKSLHCTNLENTMQSNGIAVPKEETTVFRYNKEVRRYPPYTTETMELDDEIHVPLQMLTAEEKIYELSQVIEKKNEEIMEIKHHGTSVPAPVVLGNHNESDSSQMKSYIQENLLEVLEGINFQIAEGTYAYGQVAEDLAQMQEVVERAMALSSGSENAVPTPTPDPKVQLRIPIRQKSPEPKLVAAEQPALKVDSISPLKKEKSRPLTVDEMIMLKKQEIQRKREMEAVYAKH